MKQMEYCVLYTSVACPISGWIFNMGKPMLHKRRFQYYIVAGSMMTKFNWQCNRTQPCDLRTRPKRQSAYTSKTIARLHDNLDGNCCMATPTLLNDSIKSACWPSIHTSQYSYVVIIRQYIKRKNDVETQVNITCDDVWQLNNVNWQCVFDRWWT